MDDLAEDLVEGLNSKQKENFFKILEFFLEPGDCRAFVLRGYAGTGKTFLIKRIVEWINRTQGRRNRIAITAPTNKAVQVLYSLSEFAQSTSVKEASNLFDTRSTVNSITYSTIHKLLGLKEQITPSGQQRFVASKGESNEILEYQYLIVDEVSMLDDSLCTEILKFSNEVRILFVGDGAQIPPINRNDCIPFRNDHGFNFCRGELDQIMRQKEGNPIIEHSFKIRNNLSEVQPIPVLRTQTDENGNGIIFIDGLSQRDRIRPLLNEYFNTQAFKDDANYAKVIAWRNKTIEYINSIIRELVYGENLPRFVVGEKLIAASPIFVQNRIYINNSEEMTVLEIKTKTERFYERSYFLEALTYNMKVELYDPGTKRTVHKYISVIHEESQKEYKSLLDAVKQKAISLSSKDLWVSFYNIQKWSADVIYNYAITCHKSQGSTYKNVFLLEEDIDHNRKAVERNRIKYTAYSRASEKLFILRTNYD